ncbi:MAG: FkbM family methyltransferase [Vicinamibacterales bacterium]
MTIRLAAGRMLERLGYSVSRAGRRNRFDAARPALAALAAAGLAPGLIVDAGAHAGDWTALARDVFPDVPIHAVEPDPAAMARLEARIAGWPRVTRHQVALTVPGRESVRLVDGGSTGAWVTDDPGTSASVVPATTLDALVADACPPGAAVLLKMDLEGHELAALQGATRLLAVTEAIFCEVTFYDVASAGHVLVGELVTWLAARGFQLHDVAALAGRPRDGRLRTGDVIFARTGGRLDRDRDWA